MKPIFLSLLIFCLAMKNVKAKVKKIQIFSSRANHSLDVTFVNSSYLVAWTYDQN